MDEGERLGRGERLGEAGGKLSWLEATPPGRTGNQKLARQASTKAPRPSPARKPGPGGHQRQGAGT